MAGNRPEARPLSLDVLDHYQIEAIEHISKTLLNALKALEQIPTRKDDPSPREGDELDRFRANNTFFLSGEAGGGRTTVYLSLRKALADRSAPEDEDRKKRLKSLESLQAGKRPEQLVWLEPLDLESAPMGDNFLAAVLVRIEEKLDPKAHFGKAQHRRGLLDASRSDHLREFDSLKNDAVLAWEGNVPQRAEHLDPDIYSQEVIRAAKASLQVKLRLQKALDGLFVDAGEPKRLFVLPVDDSNLRPSASLKLLHLLRMIAVPQLFILVMGDFYTLEELVYQDTLGNLLSLAGERALQGSDSRRRQWRSLSGTATVLASDTLRKLIPAGQRYNLEVMYELGALHFYPAQLDPQEVQARAGASQYRYTVKDLLGLLPIEVPLASREASSRYPSLLAFLRLRPTAEEGQGEEDYTYSGLAVLDLPPRQVVDLWYSIKAALPDLPDEAVAPMKCANEEREKKREKEIDVRRDTLVWSDEEGKRIVALGFVSEIAKAVVAGQSYMSKEDQDTCSYAVEGARGISKRTFDSTHLWVKPDRMNRLDVVLEDGKELRISLHQRWLFYPRRSRGSVPTQRDAPMAPRPTAWFTVLHDLAALSEAGHMEGAPLTPDPFNFHLVDVSAGNSLVSWPTPAWRSFWHFDRLAFAWRRVVERSVELSKCFSDEQLAEWFSFHWIYYIHSILEGSGQDLKGKPLEREEMEWAAVVQGAEQLADVATSRAAQSSTKKEQQLVTDWLIHLKCMLTTEFGVPGSVVAEFAKSAALKAFWSSRETSIENARKKAGHSTTEPPKEGLG